MAGGASGSRASCSSPATGPAPPRSAGSSRPRGSRRRRSGTLTGPGGSSSAPRHRRCSLRTSASSAHPGPATPSPTSPGSGSSAGPSSAASSTNISGPRRSPGQGWWPSSGPHRRRQSRGRPESDTENLGGCGQLRSAEREYRTPQRVLSWSSPQLPGAVAPCRLRAFTGLGRRPCTADPPPTCRQAPGRGIGLDAAQPRRLLRGLR
jgi:hypothetical protein